MRTKGTKGMGRVTVQFLVANNDDMALARRGLLPVAQVRQQTIEGVVDSGAARLVLPGKLVKQLGLSLEEDKIKVRYADGRRASRPQVKGVYVELLGRDSTFTAVVQPRRETALIGAIVLEDLDLLVDCQRQRVVPRDPAGPLYEIE